MRTTGSGSEIEDQLSRLLDYKAPVVTLEEVLERPQAGAGTVSRWSTRRSAGPRPALVWSFALLLLVIAGVGIFVGVSAKPVSRPVQIGTPTTQTTRPARVVTPPTPRLTDFISLDQSRVVAGAIVEGYVVVQNPGVTINLTPGTEPGGKRATGCRPSLRVDLSNDNVSQAVSFTLPCETEPFPIPHGTTRLPVSVITTYTECHLPGRSSGVSGVSMPTCTKSGMPPALPAGTYYANLEWSQPVHLPKAKPAVLVLITPTKGSTATVTQQEKYQPWATTTSLLPGIQVIGSLNGGNCWTDSLPDYDNEHAWRCMAGSEIYDPCFSPPGASKVTEVACASSPTSGVYLMKLQDAFEPGSSPRTSGGTYAWYLVLSGGETCSRFDGAGPPSVAGVTLDYVCSNGQAGDPDRSTTPWIDEYAANGDGPLVEVSVIQAWN